MAYKTCDEWLDDSAADGGITVRQIIERDSPIVAARAGFEVGRTCEMLQNAAEFAMPLPLSRRGIDWMKFASEVSAHIESYTVPQYGDKGEDIASEYSPEYCLQQVKKYTARFGRNERAGQEKLDLLKMAHYIQMAWEAMSNGKENNS